MSQTCQKRPLVLTLLVFQTQLFPKLPELLAWFPLSMSQSTFAKFWKSIQHWSLGLFPLHQISMDRKCQKIQLLITFFATQTFSFQKYSPNLFHNEKIPTCKRAFNANLPCFDYFIGILICEPSRELPSAMISADTQTERFPKWLASFFLSMSQSIFFNLRKGIQQWVFGFSFWLHQYFQRQKWSKNAISNDFSCLSNSFFPYI